MLDQEVYGFGTHKNIMQGYATISGSVIIRCKVTVYSYLASLWFTSYHLFDFLLHFVDKYLRFSHNVRTMYMSTCYFSYTFTLGVSKIEN
jgi:hypothetical protein